jgi:putative acetyltransferase
MSLVPEKSALPAGDYRILPFHRAYAGQVSRLYHEAVRAIRHPRYSPSQLAAWSRAPRSEKHWQLRLTRSRCWLLLYQAQHTGLAGQPQCCGFINVETAFASRGYIDSLYIAPAHQGKGLGRSLYLEAERFARSKGYPALSVDASFLSRPLFELMGFALVQRSYQQKQGQIIPGFYMTKKLLPE